LSLLEASLTASLGIDYPIIGGAMYRCSNHRHRRHDLHHGMSYRDDYLAGRSIEVVEAVEPVGTIVERFVATARQQDFAVMRPYGSTANQTSLAPA